MENITHLLCDCSRDTLLWSSLGLDINSDFYNLVGPNWFYNQLRHHNGILFACACWFIWRSRNVEAFEDTVWSPWYILSQIRSTANFIQSSIDNPMQQAHRLVSWSLPPDGWVKINSDGPRVTLVYLDLALVTR